MTHRILILSLAVALPLGLAACRSTATPPPPAPAPAPAPVPEPAPEPSPAVSSDQRIHDEVHAALERAPGVDATNIAVSVNDGNVVLTGHVHSAVEIDRAHEIAHAVRGVRSVDHTKLEIN